jgi:hypothetical protein
MNSDLEFDELQDRDEVSEASDHKKQVVNREALIRK